MPIQIGCDHVHSKTGILWAKDFNPWAGFKHGVVEWVYSTWDQYFGRPNSWE